VTAFGDLPLEPLSDHYGLDRGTPVDRWYIERFLSTRRRVIHGAVLEVQDDIYTTRFGEDRVRRSIVVDIDATNPNATLIADLQLPGALPPDSYDCIILTQTLHLLRRPGVCVANCFAALRPGGVLLATAPSVSRVSPRYPENDFWRFTPSGLAELFSRHWRSNLTVSGLGQSPNMHGLPPGEVVEDLPEVALNDHDPRFPLTVSVEATKTSSPGPTSNTRTTG
jgi:SAM-dependent methyltransferase